METIKLGDYILGIIVLFLSLGLFLAFLRDVVKWISGKKKKFRKEYEVKIFVVSGNHLETVIYHRDAVEKVEMWGKNYIEIKLKNGDYVEYEGFKFIVHTYKIPHGPKI